MKEKNLTQGNILRSLITFALPVLAALFLQAMYGAVDLLVVGKFSGTADQSGVATGAQLINMFTMVITGLCMGVTVFTGEAIGAGEPKKAGDGIGTGICIFAMLAVIITAILVPESTALSRLMKAPDEALSKTSDYVRICGAGTFFIISYNVLGAVFRGIGDSKTPLITVAIACVVNIFGDLLLCAGFGMGAAGAAIATVAAQAVSVVISLVMIRHHELPFVFSVNCIRPNRRYVQKILRVGIPIALQELLVGCSFMFIQIIVNNQMGIVGSASIGIAEKVCSFLMLVSSAYMQSISAFVAQNNGAGLPDRSVKALQYGIGTAFAVGTLLGVLSFIFGNYMSAIFSDDPAVIVMSHQYLRSYSIDCLLTAVLFCFVGYFNGCEHTVFVMVQGIIGAFFVRIPVAWLMSRIPGATLFHIGLATPCSSVVQIAMCLFAYRAFQGHKHFFH